MPQVQPPAQSQVAERSTIAFVGVNVVPMDAQRVLPNETVVVENGRIVSLGASVVVPRMRR